MTQPKVVQSFYLVLLALTANTGWPVSGQCVEETDCTRIVEEYHYQLTNMPNNLNERSIAAWTYEPKTDLNRVPQVIHEAKCLSSHTCRDVKSRVSLETIPISVRIPVLRKSHICSTYSLEFESIAIACICATPRRF
ncbi:hypothetical protein AAFF_G00177510 [Aldrovandia affinis]|uniref:Uncharacterized protein n=1 Tax=Aldrovandia affinis TaxID=143900 RepID=A0AAD7RLD2_9TELE|nr:hypothetical protein AAFF_G00177510 [Aldrovandia affinis]